LGAQLVEPPPRGRVSFDCYAHERTPDAHVREVLSNLTDRDPGVWRRRLGVGITYFRGMNGVAASRDREKRMDPKRSRVLDEAARKCETVVARLEQELERFDVSETPTMRRLIVFLANPLDELGAAYYVAELEWARKILASALKSADDEIEKLEERDLFSFRTTPSREMEAKARTLSRDAARLLGLGGDDGPEKILQVSSIGVDYDDELNSIGREILDSLVLSDYLLGNTPSVLRALSQLLMEHAVSVIKQIESSEINVLETVRTGERLPISTGSILERIHGAKMAFLIITLRLWSEFDQTPRIKDAVVARMRFIYDANRRFERLDIASRRPAADKVFAACAVTIAEDSMNRLLRRKEELTRRMIDTPAFQFDLAILRRYVLDPSQKAHVHAAQRRIMEFRNPIIRELMKMPSLNVQHAKLGWMVKKFEELPSINNLSPAEEALVRSSRMDFVPRIDAYVSEHNSTEAILDGALLLQQQVDRGGVPVDLSGFNSDLDAACGECCVLCGRLTIR